MQYSLWTLFLNQLNYLCFQLLLFCYYQLLTTDINRSYKMTLLDTGANPGPVIRNNLDDWDSLCAITNMVDKKRKKRTKNKYIDKHIMEDDKFLFSCLY